MELGNKIKEYRLVLKLTQDDLAEKMYVSRQTISNWENDKSYPDIHSLILFSELVGVSLDQLVKGDIETMERNISETEAKKLKKYRLVFGILIVLLIGLAIPLYLRLGRYACIPFGILFIATMLCRFVLPGAEYFDPALCPGTAGPRNRPPCGNVPQLRTAATDKIAQRASDQIDGAYAEGRLRRMNQPKYKGKELLPLSVIDAARDGDAQAVDSVLRYYEGYINKLSTRTLYDPDGQPRVRVDEYMKRRLEIKLIHSIVSMN